MKLAAKAFLRPATRVPATSSMGTSTRPMLS